MDKRARLNEGLADCLLTHVVVPPARSRLACEDRRALRGGVCSEREEAPRLSLTEGSKTLASFVAKGPTCSGDIRASCI